MREMVARSRTPAEAAPTLVQFGTKFDEADALSFAIQTVWIDAFDEIPGILREIRSARSMPPAGSR